jgi:hypothetical protein
VKNPQYGIYVAIAGGKLDKKVRHGKQFKKLRMKCW